MYLLKPFPVDWMWHKVNFEEGLYWFEFTVSIFYTDCLVRSKEVSLPNSLLIVRRRTEGFVPLLMRWNANSAVQVLNSRRRFNFLRGAYSISYDDSISNDDNCYAITSLKMNVISKIYASCLSFVTWNKERASFLVTSKTTVACNFA